MAGSGGRADARSRGRCATEGRAGGHCLRGRGAINRGADGRRARSAPGAHSGSAGPAYSGIRQAGARRQHPGSGRWLQNDHQGGAPRGRPQLRQEPQTAAQALAAGARNPGRDRLQTARHRARSHGHTGRPGCQRSEDAARPQADRRSRAQERHRQTDPLPDHQGVSDPVRSQGPERAAIAQGVRRDPAHGIRRRGAAGTAARHGRGGGVAPDPPDVAPPAPDLPEQES